ncbi:MAG TPA: threonine/serine dehydratase [Tissierellia bacterium]|jgi:threonine dehydratase|nr:threonine/serine dehydratase [Tissierellia bacterium]
MVNFNDVVSARDRIKKYISLTPLDFSMVLSKERTKVYLKLECQQKQKAFKVRGALSKISSLTDEEKERGVIAVSSGNHGAGVSFASYLLGIKNAKVFVPETAPKAKVDKIKYYGAEIVQVGKNYDEAHKVALDEMKKNNMTYIDSCSDVQLIAGQGTVGLEIMEQNSDIDTIIVPIGGGGLITGISVAAKHMNPNVKIIGVQTAACPAMVKSLEDNVLYEEFPSEDSICDALIGGVTEIPFKMAKKCIDDILVVSEESIRKATKLLLTEEKVVAEPSGAVGVAALLENPKYFEGKNIAIVISGGNLDKDLMEKIISS